MRIAIAIDGSDHCLRALKQALAFADKMKESSTFVLVNVHLSALLSPVARGIDRQQIEQYMDQIAEEELAEAKKILAATGRDWPHRTDHKRARRGGAGYFGSSEKRKIRSPGCRRERPWHAHRSSTGLGRHQAR